MFPSFNISSQGLEEFWRLGAQPQYPITSVAEQSSDLPRFVVVVLTQCCRSVVAYCTFAVLLFLLLLKNLLGYSQLLTPPSDSTITTCLANSTIGFRFFDTAMRTDTQFFSLDPCRLCPLLLTLVATFTDTLFRLRFSTTGASIGSTQLHAIVAVPLSAPTTHFQTILHTGGGTAF